MKTLLIRAVIACVLILPLYGVCGAQSSEGTGRPDTWTLQVFGGTAYNFKTHLSVSQDGFDKIGLTAKYDTGGTGAPYYAWRVGRWIGDEAWEFEHIHHKLELDNNPPEIQDFQISHGFNMFFLNKAEKRGEWIMRYGAGLVIAHPENTVRGRELKDGDGGYYLSGVAAQYATEKRFDLSDRFFASVEAKLTAAYAQVKVVDGHANVTNIAVHGLIGIGYRF